MTTNERLKLICTLTRHVVTGEGDFVPAGTPVQVIGWSGNDNGEELEVNGKVEVRASAYMYADGFDYSAIEDGSDTGAVNTGLFLSVPPNALRYDEERTGVVELRQRRKAGAR